MTGSPPDAARHRRPARAARLGRLRARRLVQRTGSLLLVATLPAASLSAKADGSRTVAPPPRADAFAWCAEQFSARPDVYESSYCFFQVAQEGKRWEEGARRLDALRASHPRNSWLTLARGNIEWSRDPARAEALYREAAAGFAETGLAMGEVLARTNLRTMLYRKGRLEEAGREVERAVKVAEAAGQDLVLARALALQAMHLIDSGRDLLVAYRTLRRAERAAFPDGPYTLRRSITFSLGNVCFQLGRLDEALDNYRRVEAMTEETQDKLTLASARYNVVNTLFRQLEDLPRPGGREEVVGLARAALATAVDADNREIQAMLHRALGELLSARDADRAESREQYERCIRVARSIQQPRELAHCLWSMARGLAEDGHAQEARGRIEEALALARKTGHFWSLALASRERMRVSWATRPRETAIAEALESLDAIEAVRRLQAEEGGSAEAFSAWAGDYLWLVGHLLEGGTEGRSRHDVERAFAVAERMRARVLLDTLGAAGAGAVPARGDPLVTRRRELLQRIADAHRELLDPATPAEGRKAIATRLDSLELEEQEVRRELRAASPHVAAYEEPHFARLADVEARLGPHEALVSFQVGLSRDFLGQDAGGAWVMVSTRAGTVVHPIPDRARLQAVVPVFVQLFTRRDGSEVRASTTLFHDLFGPALGSLPPEVDRLVIVPDDILHRLPFAALRTEAGAEPLGARFELTLAPSATLWLRGRLSANGSPPPAALVLADPTLRAGPEGPSSAAATRDLAWESSLRRLPHAREEGRAVARRLGGSTLWTGDDASEAALKKARLDRFSLLHFATHAVADEERPERSSVVLAPGSESEDGLLQSREIVELPFAGRVVVLAACQSAGGSVLRGEGVMSIARAFFQGGSPAVVGSLWPLRDDETTLLFDVFYRHLASGASLGAALRSAQRDAIGARRPSDAWAGLVVMGDGGRIPFPGGANAARPSLLLVLAVVGALLAGLGLWTLRGRAS